MADSEVKDDKPKKAKKVTKAKKSKAKEDACMEFSRS